MKYLTHITLLALVCLSGATAYAEDEVPDSYAVQVKKCFIDPNSGTEPILIQWPAGAANYIMMGRGSDKMPIAALLDSHLTLSSGTLTVGGFLPTPTGTTSQVVRGDGSLGTMTSAASAYEGTTARAGWFPVFKTATVASGVAVIHLTNDGLSTGTALFPTGPIADSVNVSISDATASYQMSWAFTNSNKTITITANKLTTANILTGLLGQVSANGSVLKLQIAGY